MVTSQSLNPNADGLNAEQLRRKIATLCQKLGPKPQPKLEARLIDLRGKLAATFTDQADYPAPDQRFKTDMFAGETGIPEIDAKDLSAKAIASGVLFHGGLIIRGLYNSDQIERLKSASTVECKRKLKDPKSIISAFTFCRLMQVYEEAGLLESIKDYLGPEAIIILERARVRHKDKTIAGGLGWHQDGSYFGEKCFALNCWAAVSPCGVNNCGLLIIPRRNESRIGWSEDGKAPLHYADGIGPHIREIRKITPPVQPVFGAGDAIIFDEMSLHRTYVPDSITEEQIVSISWFFARSRLLGYKTALAI